jgi:hypothetical protein
VLTMDTTASHTSINAIGIERDRTKQSKILLRGE